MIDVTRIWERLFLGSLLDAERLGKANPLGITTVVSLSETAPCNTRPDITYIHVPIEDERVLPLEQFDAIMRAIAENIRHGNVLLHCGSGISRAAIMVAAYLHLVGYADFDAALAEIAMLRPIVSPWSHEIATVNCIFINCAARRLLVLSAV